MNRHCFVFGIDQNSVDRFKEDGFLLVEDFFTDNELNAFAAEVDGAVEYRTSDDQRKLAEKNLYEQTFMQCMGLWEDHESVRPLTFHPKLCAAAAALLESDRVQLWHDQALYKQAGGRKTDAHMDYPFWPVDKPSLVSAWIPFADVKHGGGVMGYVQGSHIMGKVHTSCVITQNKLPGQTRYFPSIGKILTIANLSYK